MKQAKTPLERLLAWLDELIDATQSHQANCDCQQCDYRQRLQRALGIAQEVSA